MAVVDVTNLQRTFAAKRARVAGVPRGLPGRRWRRRDGQYIAAIGVDYVGLPLAIGIGAGSAVRGPLAIVKNLQNSIIFLYKEIDWTPC